MRALSYCLLAALLTSCAAIAQDEPAKTVLVFSGCTGFRHTTCTYGKPAITAIGEESGAFTTICTEDPGVFNEEFLGGIDCVIQNNGTGSMLNDEQKAALLDFVRGGGGFVGIHAATDSHYDWPEYVKLVGGWFDGHPWNEEVAIRIEVPDHPASKGIESPWRIADEIYQHRDWDRDEMCVVMSLDPDGTNMQKDGMKREDGDYGIAWCRPYGDGRSFYTALGHRNEVFDNPVFQKHLLNAILWAMGEIDFECEPHPMPE